MAKKAKYKWLKVFGELFPCAKFTLNGPLSRPVVIWSKIQNGLSIAV